MAQFNAATDEKKKKRGVDRIITFTKDSFEIKDQDKVKFDELEREATVPLVGMYILEKIKAL